MISKEQKIKDIFRFLAILKVEVELHNAVNFTDINVSSEDLFKEVFNTAFDLNLKNMNEYSENTPAIDLGDEVSGVSIQVTSTNDRTKITSTLETFAEHGLDKKYSVLKIFLLADKKNYKPFTVPPGIKLEIEDISDFVRAVKSLSITKIEAVRSCLEKELRPIEDAKGAEYVATIEHHSSMDYAKYLLDQDQPKTAVAFLEREKSRIWSVATAKVRFRLLTNLGAAKVRLGFEIDAADLFMEAAKTCPNEIDAQTNLANAYLIRGQEGQAREAAKKVIAIDERNSRAYAIIIQCCRTPSELSDVVASIPNDMLEEARIQFNLSCRYQELSMTDEAIAAGRAAIDGTGEKLRPVEIGHFGCVLLSSIVSTPSDKFSGRSTPEKLKIVEEARGLLTQAITRLLTSELDTLTSHYLYNRGVASLLMGENDKAIEDLTFTINRNPDNGEYRRTLAKIFADRSETNRALYLLKPSVESGDVRSTLFYADLLTSDGQLSEATKLVELILKPGIDPDLALGARELLINIYLQDGDLSSAAKAIEDISDETVAQQLMKLVYRARIARRTSNSDMAKAKLLEAVELISGNVALASEHYIQACAIAQDLCSFKIFEKAIPLMESLVSSNGFHPLLPSLIDACYQSKMFDEALKHSECRLSACPDDYLAIQIKLAILEELGDIEQAITVCQQYVSLNLTNLHAQLRLAYLRLRAGNAETEVDGFLSSVDSSRADSPSIALLLSRLCFSRGLRDKSLEVLYEANRKFPRNSDIKMAFFQSFAFRDRETDGSFNLDTVAEGATVTYELSSGVVNTVTVENRAEVDLLRGEINLDDPIFRKLSGMRTGNNFVWKSSNIQTIDGSIKDIQHKYVALWREIGKTFGGEFPDESGIITMSVPDGIKSIADLPSEMLKTLDLQAEERRSTEDVLKLHFDGVAPVGMVANAISESTYECIETLFWQDKAGLLCALGNKAETLAGLSVARPNCPIALEITSLMTLRVLGLEGKVKDFFGKIYIAQSLLDEVHEILLKRKQNSHRERMQIWKEGDKFYREIIGPERIQENIKFVEDTLNWLRETCEVKPRRLVLSINATERQKLEDAIGRVSLDPILIAREQGAVLLADDEPLRRLAQSEFGVGGAWTRIVIEQLMHYGKLTVEEYARSVVTLLQLGHRFVSVNADILLYVAKKEGFLRSKDFELVAHQFGGNASEMRGAAIALGRFFLRMWESVVPYTREVEILTYAIKAYMAGREPRSALQALKTVLEHEFALLPVDLQKYLSIVDSSTIVSV